MEHFQFLHGCIQWNFDIEPFNLLRCSAIELLSLPDSMCRIAAQSTILNVFGVFDKRAREYALQDEMVNKMFAAVVFFMHSQYDKISSACMAYVMVCQYIILFS